MTRERILIVTSSETGNRGPNNTRESEHIVHCWCGYQRSENPYCGTTRSSHQEFHRQDGAQLKPNIFVVYMLRLISVKLRERFLRHCVRGVKLCDKLILSINVRTPRCQTARSNKRWNPAVPVA